VLVKKQNETKTNVEEQRDVKQNVQKSKFT
jgi:hypothetical protein